MANNLLIIGAGGHGKVVAESAAKMGRWSEIAFLDDKFPAPCPASVKKSHKSCSGNFTLGFFTARFPRSPPGPSEAIIV